MDRSSTIVLRNTSSALSSSNINDSATPRFEDGPWFYGSILCMFLSFCLGLPLNILVLYRLIARVRVAQTLSRAALLKINLNISDLLVFVLFVIPRWTWKLTYFWWGGDFLCKLVLFCYTFVFYLSSTALAVIGIDRLCQVIRPFALSERSNRIVRASIVVSWVYSFLFALPLAYYFFTVDTPDRSYYSPQCVNRVSYWTMILRVKKNMSETAVEAYLSPMNTLFSVYSLVHLITLFWIPFFIIIISYSVMMQQICRYLVCADVRNLMEAMENRRNSRASVEGQLTKNTSSTPARTEVTAITASRGTVNSRVALLRNSKHSLLQRVATSSSIQVSTATLQRMATQTSLYLNPSANRQGANSIHTSMKMLKTAFVLITVFFVCWLPYNIIMLCEFFNIALPFNLDKQIMDEVSKQLIILNSVINPLLYGFTRKDLRALCQQMRKVLQTVSKCLCCVCCICCKLFTYDWDESSDVY